MNKKIIFLAVAAFLAFRIYQLKQWEVPINLSTIFTGPMVRTWNIAEQRWE